MNVKTDISELIALRDRIQKLLDIDLDAYCSAVTKDVAAKLFDTVIKRTPRKTNKLAESCKYDSLISECRCMRKGEILARRENEDEVAGGHDTEFEDEYPCEIYLHGAN